MRLLVNSIDYKGSIVDGPGIRTVLFVQGCQQKCEDCHNPSAWDLRKGNDYEVNDLIEELTKKCLNRKLTISGGEPLLQYPAILELVKNLNNFDITIYTGFEFEDVPHAILKYINYIKVGNFIKGQRTTIIPFIGSKNQRFIDLRGENNKIN